VDQEKITLTEEFEGGLQLWPCGVFARSLVCENLIELNALKLAFRGLIKGAYSPVTHPLVVPFCCHHLGFPQNV
jgi:hypothetical protein